MLKIGITGGIGSGKSTVCRIFELLGVSVFYSDEESKKIIQSDPAIIGEVKRIFGTILYRKGILDRQKLASIVFNDPEKLKMLNELLHPAVFRKFENWCKEKPDQKYVIQEAALIFESGAEKYLDSVVMVTAPESLRMERIRKRDGVSTKEVKVRMKNQWTEEEKTAHADHIIINDGNQLIIPQVIKLHQHFMDEAQ